MGDTPEDDEPRPTDYWYLSAILCLALALRLYVIWTQLYVVHADETFQYLEQAHRLVFKAGVVPWEFIDGARSWLVPGLIAGVLRAVTWFTSDPSIYLRAIRACAAVLALSPVYIGFRLGQRVAGTPGAVLTGTLCAVWFELIYFAPLVLTEVFSAHIALWALYLNMTSGQPGRFAARRLILAGGLFGLAVCLRVQNGPALLCGMLWLNRLDWRRWRWLVSGGLPVVLLLGGVLDTVTLGLPFQSIWLNTERNIWQGVGAINGHESWSYFPYRIKWIWHFALAVGAFAAAGAIRVPALALTAIVTVAVHSFIEHKEYRFIYLALAISPILAGVGMAWLATSLARWTGGGIRPAYVVAILLPSVTTVSWYTGTHDLMTGMWSFHRSYAQVFLAAHDRPDLCGIGVGTKVFDSTGYTYLHRDVPMYFSNYEAISHVYGMPLSFRTHVEFHGHPLAQYPGPEMASNTGRFNYLIAHPGDAYPNYVPVACFAGQAAPEICLYRRPGPCE